jgi:hypothetical protein
MLDEIEANRTPLSCMWHASLDEVKQKLTIGKPSRLDIIVSSTPTKPASTHRSIQVWDFSEEVE